VRIDEGHFNRWSTRVLIEGRSYAGLAQLLRDDGYVVAADTTRFTAEWPVRVTTTGSSPST